MSLYTTLDDSALQEIIQQYEITAIKNWHILNGGTENTNYYLETANKKYVLTICERKTIEETTNLTELLRHLEKSGFSTTKIILTKSNEQLGAYQQKPILLKAYLDGIVLDSFDAITLERLGASIAQLNLIPAPAFLPKQFAYGRQYFSELFETNSNRSFIVWLKKMNDYILDNLDPNLPKALIHGDIFFSNVIVDSSQQPTIMDFEESCHYYRVFELGMAITGLCQKDGLIEANKASSLLRGYQRITPLTPLELKKLKPFIVYAATATAFWRFRQFNILSPNEEYKDSYLAMKRIADQVFNNNFEL